MSRTSRAAAGVALAVALAGALNCGASPAAPAPARDYLVDVVGERFVIRLADPEAIALAEANLRGANTRIPFGTVRRGHGGFNQPWSWHLDPDDATFVDVAIEVCDGRPSYLEAHLDEYPRYCPWGGRVIARR